MKATDRAVKVDHPALMPPFFSSIFIITETKNRKMVIFVIINCQTKLLHETKSSNPSKLSNNNYIFTCLVTKDQCKE